MTREEFKLIRDLFYIGITHETAPLAVRERARPDADKQREMLDRLARLARGRMVLTTCERFEIYAHGTRPGRDAWVRALADWFHLPAALVARHLRIESGLGVAEHLLRVAAGLESRILGESAILGQVRFAFQQALETYSLDPELSALARAAIHTGKRVRHETVVCDGARSIAALAVDRIAALSGSIRGLFVVVVGTGQLSAEVASELTARRARRIVVAGRNAKRTAALAKKFGATPAALHDLPAALRASDAAVACTSAPSYVIDQSVVGSGRTRALALVDLSVPRNIDPTVAHLPNVRLTHLDGLSCERNARQEGIAAANRIVQEELHDVLAWIRHRRVAPGIVELIDNAERRRADGGRIDRRTLHQRIIRLKAEAAA